MSEPFFQQNLLNILGENVSLTPTGLSSRETIAVSFDQYYIPPDINGSQIDFLKNTMRQLFENKLKKIVDTDSGEELDEKKVDVFPPCGEEEKAMVLKSLLHRKAVLEQELYDIGIKTPDEIRAKLTEMAKTKRDQPLQGQDSLLARQHLVHYLKLKRFINSYDEQQYCIYLEDIAYGEEQKELTDDMVKELLKQFIFFVLQSHHPLDDFKKTDPTAPSFVSRLERKPLKDRFYDFLDSYEENDLPIPAAIAAVLESTELNPSAMTEEIDKRVKQCKKDILNYINTILPKSDPFWKRPKDTENLESVLDALVQYPKDLLNEIKLLESEKKSLLSRINACEQAKQLLEKQKNILEKQSKDFYDQLQATKGKDEQMRLLTQERDAARNELAARLATITAEQQGYERRIADCEARMRQKTLLEADLRREIDGLTRENQRLTAVAAQAQTDLQGLQALLAAEKAKVVEQTKATGAAAAAAQAANQELLGKVEELADANAAVAAKDKLIKACETDTAALRTLLKEKEAEILKIRGELERVKEEHRQRSADLAKANEATDALKAQIAELGGKVEDSKTQEDANQEEIARLRDELAKEAAKAKDLGLEVAGLKDELTRLRGSVSGTTAEVESLTTKIKLEEEKKQAALDERDALAAQISSLKSELQESKKATKAQSDLVAERTSELQETKEDLDEAKEDAATQRKRADTAEGKVKEILAEKDALATSMGQQVKAIEQTLGAQYQESLARVKATFDETLAGQEESSSAEVEKTKAAHELLREVVVAVASEADPRAKVAELGDVPERVSLDTILTRLAAAKPASPLAEAAERKKEASMQCYYVFLLSFLWQTNFPSLGTEPTEKTILNFFRSVFTNGPDLKDTTGTKFLDGVNAGLYSKLKGDKPTLIKDYFRVIQTLAKAIEGNTAGPIEFIVTKQELKAAEEAKYKELTSQFVNQINILSALYTTNGKFSTGAATAFQRQALKGLSLNADEKSELNTKTKAILAGKTELSEEDKDALIAEIEKFTGTNPEFSKELKTLSLKQFSERIDLLLGKEAAPEGFIEYMNQFLLSRQPLLNTDRLNKRIVVDATGVTLGDEGNVNYTVLFYSFLMLLLDYLKSIENSGDQCRLPEFLRTSGR